MKDFYKYAQELKYKEIHFGLEVLPYLKKCLEDGTSLGKTILEKIDLEDGKVITLLEESVSEASAVNFESGGKIPVPTELSALYKESNLQPKLDTGFWLALIIKEALQQGGKCFIESYLLLRPSYNLDEEKQREKILTFNNKEIYFVKDTEDAQKGKMPSAMSSNTPWPTLLGIVCKTNKKPYVLGFNNITEKDLEYFVDHIEKIIFNAYDGESFLIWSKN